VLLTKIMSLSA